MTSNPDLTQATLLLDYTDPSLQALIAEKGWRDLNDFDRIGAVYDFVRNDIAFGYNAHDALPASRILADGYGQCNTKGTLLMALLRALGIACRLHGFTIHKALQRGVVPEAVYRITPDSILHSWVEVQVQPDKWVNLEGFILDAPYLSRLQSRFNTSGGSFCGYGVGADDLQTPNVAWCGESTYIQRTGINQDFGVFDSPDAFYQAHSQSLSFMKERLYRYVLRHWMNARVRRIRAGKVPKALTRHSHQTQTQ